MDQKPTYACTLEKAGHIKFALHILGWSMTETAAELRVNVGTVSHVYHGRRFAEAQPVPIPGYSAAGLKNQPEDSTS